MVLRGLSFFFNKIKKMINIPAAFWSTPYDARDRTTHQRRTKQRRKEQQRRHTESGTWEHIADEAGPWHQAGEYRRPKEELEAAKEWASREWASSLEGGCLRSTSGHQCVS